MIAVNVSHATKEEKIYPAYISKHNLKCEKQVILLLIPDRKNQIKFIVWIAFNCLERKHADLEFSIKRRWM